MNMTFEDFIRERVTKGEIVFGSHKQVHTTETMLKYVASYITSPQINMTFIYNHEDNKCYYVYDKKLYRLSGSFEEVKL